MEWLRSTWGAALGACILPWTLGAFESESRSWELRYRIQITSARFPVEDLEHVRLFERGKPEPYLGGKRYSVDLRPSMLRTSHAAIMGFLSAHTPEPPGRRCLPPEGVGLRLIWDPRTEHLEPATIRPPSSGPNGSSVACSEHWTSSPPPEFLNHVTPDRMSFYEIITDRRFPHWQGAPYPNSTGFVDIRKIGENRGELEFAVAGDPHHGVHARPSWLFAAVDRDGRMHFWFQDG